ncbi:MAG: DUF3137 domain-containing protein [Nanoarchaeota archaeon]|nr:DUF3137 domain-containing protein [Nanoarchaeota archaeon]
MKPQIQQQNTNQNSQFWDPTGRLPNLEILEQNRQSILQKSQYWKENLSKITKKFNLIYVISFLIFSILIIFLQNFELFIPLIIVYFTIIAIFYAIVYTRLKSLKKDLIKIELANHKNWLYEPEKSSVLYQDYYRIFPEIFNLGEKFQNIEDVFWGNITRNSLNHSFVSGLFNYTYTVVERTKNGTRRKDVHCTDHFFILKLPKTISSRFYLFPKNLMNKFTNMFTKKNIQTESLEFNKRFSFSYQKAGNEVQIDIMTILSPRVIEELVNFSKVKEKNIFSNKSSLINGLEVLFTQNCVIFLTPGPLIEKLNVSISSQSLKISPEELKEVEELMNFYIDISTEISKYLN